MSNRMGEERINRDIEGVESTLAGIWGKTFTKIEINTGIEEQLVKYLAIEEALQTKIKEALEHKNQSYVDWCDLSYKEKIKTRFNLLLYMIWVVRRDHMVVDMTPLADIHSSLVVEAKLSLEWFSIPRPSGSMMLWKREEKKHDNMSSQRTPREAQVWRILQF